MPVVQGGATYTAERILRLIEQEELRFVEAFERGLDNLDDAELVELAELLQLGLIDDALALVGFNKAAELLAGAYGSAFVRAGEDAASVLSDIVLTSAIAFNIASASVAEPIAASRFRIIGEFTLGQQASVQRALTEALARQLEPIETARLFKQSIGLTEKQFQAVINYRRLLEEGNRDALSRALRDPKYDDALESALRGDTVLTARQIDRMVEGFRRNSIRHRARVIAEHEALGSVHQGIDAMLSQAMESGEVEEEQIEREWTTAGDSHVRGSHKALSGVVRGPNETFPGTYSELRYPGDPNADPQETVGCRCHLEIRFKYVEE